MPCLWGAQPQGSEEAEAVVQVKKGMRIIDAMLRVDRYREACVAYEAEQDQWRLKHGVIYAYLAPRPICCRVTLE